MYTMQKDLLVNSRFDLSDLVEDDNIETVKSALTSAAGMISNPKIARAITLAGVAVSVGRSAQKYFQAQQSKKNFRIKIAESDALYTTIQSWLMESLQPKDQRYIGVQSKRSASGASYDSYGDRINTAPPKTRDELLRIFYDGERRQTVLIGPHKVDVFVGGEPASVLKSEGRKQQQGAGRSVYLECASFEAREAVLQILTEESMKNFDRRPRFFNAGKWGNFRSMSDVPVRPLETVVLRDGQKEKIVDGLKTFLSQEDKYVEMGIPWHMGLLLYGPPGTGKTSVATAIAHSMNLDIFTISLSSIEDDNTLFDLLGDVTPRSILLLEDIDVTHAATEGNDDRNGVTLQGLLNGLDGVSTPHGIITIMTTNHFSRLQPALFRPGRVDFKEEIGYVDNNQIRNLCTQFMGYIPEGLPVISEDHQVVAADFIDIFKKNLDNEGAIDEQLITLLEDKIREPGNDLSAEPLFEEPRITAAPAKPKARGATASAVPVPRFRL